MLRRVLALALLLAAFAARANESDAPRVGDVDHVGLTVTELERTTSFFTDVLGFELVRRDEAYPAAFVSNGQVMVSLWRASDPATATPFDRKRNVGLHHLAFAMDSFEALDALHRRLLEAEGVRIEFAPEFLSGGPARHMMIREPSGNRLEFIHRPPPAP